MINKTTKEVMKWSKWKKKMTLEQRPEWNGLSGERKFQAELTSCKGPGATVRSTCLRKNRKQCAGVNMVE